MTRQADAHLERQVCRRCYGPSCENILPFLGSQQPNDIMPPNYPPRSAKSKGAVLLKFANRVRGICAHGFCCAVAIGIAERAPATNLIKQVEDPALCQAGGGFFDENIHVFSSICATDFEFIPQVSGCYIPAGE